MALIKSHSNYVLKKNHQTISDGTIWERDITTIGGVNQFAPGQIPIYKSSNFIITVRNDGKVANQYNKTKWKENESGDVWTLETISGITSEFEGQNDVKIVLKQDYYDFCDFAYYGSLSELFRSSINDALRRFPGELYGTNEHAYYTSTSTYDFERVEERIILGGKDDFYVSNPFGIDLHSFTKPLDAKKLKYFADYGYKNYVIIENGSGTPITQWDSRIFVTVVKGKDALDKMFGGDLFYTNWMSNKLESEIATQPNREIRWNEAHYSLDSHSVISHSIDCSGQIQNGDTGWNNLLSCFESDGEIYENYSCYYNTRFHVFSGGTRIIDISDKATCKTGLNVSGYSSEASAQGKIDELMAEWWAKEPKEPEEPIEPTEPIEPEPSDPDYEEKHAEWEIEHAEWEIEHADWEIKHAEWETEHDDWEIEHAKWEKEKPNVYIYEYHPCCDPNCYFTMASQCKGDKICSVSANSTTVIDGWVGDNNSIVYLSKKTDVHIRPNEKELVKFYNECNDFQKLIFNDKTTPRYKAIFSVIKENERGYYREMENFVFPTSYGGYNIDASSYGFNDYTTRLSEIGEYYDELFTDNLYRSMTHEAIKNFDWTYTREFTYDDEEEFVHGGQKIQKALRIFAREFDEIITYINNIKNLNRVTYDERSNIPDYFLIDVNENNGWDVKLVYPYDLVEYKTDDFGNYIKDSDGNKIEFNNYDDEKTQLNGYESGESKTYFVRNFSQNTKKEIYPYSKTYVKEYPDGYFISCCETNQLCKQLCEYSGSNYYVLDATDSGTTYSDSCDGKIKNRIKSYTDERPYTYFDANNEFMRRLAINSPYIWRHKGTIEGLEMILGMFGLRSKRWVDRLTNNCLNNNIVADYEISEYSSFTNRIEEQWDAVHQMYRIDWINSTKAIVYDYRSTSNYTKYGAQTNYIPYQGLPVAFRDEYIDNTTSGTAFIAVDSLENQITSGVSGTSRENAFSTVDGKPVVRRYLYPNFDKNEQLDGNPYFQMNGGWLSKTISNASGETYNFQFDVNDNISYTPYVANGSDSDDKIIDNHSIYKETIRNIKRVDTLNDLLSVPVNTLKNGSIYYVSNIENNIAIIDNQVYPIKFEYSNPDSAPFRYISLIKNDNYIKIGNDKFFDKNIIVYDKTGAETSYFLEDKEYGYEVKAYIRLDNSFVCKADESGYYTIDSFEIFDTNMTSSSTNYFIIDNTYYSDRIDVEGNGVGWRMLYVTDPEYIKINTITNYYEGNNPHNGNMTYDSGHEYFTYFKRLFKHAIDNDLFDERCYESFYNDLDGEISNIGFGNLIHDNEMITQYEPYLVQNDSKIHYFGTYYKKSDSGITTCTDVKFYGANQNKILELSKMYKALNSEITVGGYILVPKPKDDDEMIGGSPYSAQTGIIDEITNQIINNKVFKIKFYLHNAWQSKQGQCEVKYLDDIVMNYLTQMIPSTTIIEIQYTGK